MTWRDRAARALAACEIALGATGLLGGAWLVLGSCIANAADRATADGHPHPASWGWVFALVLVPPATALMLAGISLWVRWPGRWWVQLLPLLVAGGCLAVETGRMKL